MFIHICSNTVSTITYYTNGGIAMESVFVEQVRIGKLKSFTQKVGDNNVMQTFKSPLMKKRIKGNVWLTQTHIIGDDGIDDKKLIRDKALFAYAFENYSYWEKELSPSSFHVGQMGENLVINGINEYNVFIGDTFQLGEAIIQVSQPRLPCWRLAYHVGDFHFAKKVKNSGHTGWHFRVLKEGYIKEKTKLKLIDRPYAQWSVAMCNELLHTDNYDLNVIYDLTKCHLLAKRWQILMEKRLSGQVINDRKRLYGSLYDR